MNKAILVCALSGVIMAGPALGQQKKLVGNLKQKHDSGCAAFFSFAGQSTYSPNLIFYSSAGNEEETWMNIGGKDVRLKMISQSEPTNTDEGGGEIVGSRSVEKYAGPNITVEIDLTVSWTCAVDDPGCESIGYKAIFKVKKGARRQTVKATGVFGC